MTDTFKRSAFVLLLVACGSACQCVRLEDYRVCDATVDCDPSPDASLDDAGLLATDGGQHDGGCVPDGLVDAVDSFGLDSDCDGIDGVVARQLYVDSSQGNDLSARPGDPAWPYLTLGAALRFAATDAGNAYGAVLVKSGVYRENDVEWAANVDIWGGRTGTGTWGPDSSTSTLRGGSVALIVRQVEGRTLRRFHVRAGPGAPSSIAVIVDQGSPRFIDVQLYAGPGAPEVNAGNVVDPDAGPGQPGSPGLASVFTPDASSGGPGVCGGEAGAPGGVAAKAVDGAGGAGEGPRGGAGGQPSISNCLSAPTPAQRGGDGDVGVDGDAGLPGTTFGMLSPKLVWLGADGAPGTAGTTGKPGSGGGGGAGSVDGTSSSGGSGGSGGCPGGPGRGGGAGGPSIGMLIRNARPFVGRDTLIVSESGGAGGFGGPGAMGFPGGSGGSAGPLPRTPACPPYPSGDGAAGGAGGRGGRGGPGGGGAGGHSLAVYCQLDGGLELDGGTLTAGSGGAGAGGARVGTSSPMEGCSP